MCWRKNNSMFTISHQVRPPHMDRNSLNPPRPNRISLNGRCPKNVLA